MTPKIMFEKELKIAIAAVKKSEPTFKKYFGAATDIKPKNGNFRDLVTYADKKIEQDIRKILLQHFPDYGFIGEESGAVETHSPFSWVLDPIDGTTNYIHGCRDCAIALALMYKNRPVVGVVLAPALNSLYVGAKGRGAKLNGKPIHAARVKEPKLAYGSFGWGRDIGFAAKMFPRLVPVLGKMRVIGSGIMTICYVAQGTSDFTIGSGDKIWDYAAAQIILEEAGGVLLLEKKPELKIAANPTLAKKLLAITKK